MANFGFSIDTAANWASNNPTPNADEMCMESDTRLIKVGNGSTAYNALGYVDPVVPAALLSTRYGIPGVIVTAGSISVQIAANTVYYMPFVVTSRITITTLAMYCSVAAAGASVRLSIYAANTTWTPGALQIDAGTVAVGTTGSKTVTGLSTTLPAGLYFFRIDGDGNGARPSLSGYLGSPITGAMGDVFLSSPQVLTASRTFAAAETPGTAITGMSTSDTALRYMLWAQWT